MLLAQASVYVPCIKCFNTSIPNSASDESLTVELSKNKVLLGLTFPGIFSFSCSSSDSRRFFLTSLLSGVMVVGSPSFSSLRDDENKFSNEDRPPPEVKLTPQNLQLLFVFLFF